MVSEEKGMGHGESIERKPSGVVVLVSMICSALEDVKQGKTQDYNRLIQKLADPELKDVHLRRYLQALRSCSSRLTKQYDNLVGTVLSTRWAVADQETAQEFIEFLSSLLSAQTYYLRACLRMIVKLFVPAISKDVDPSSIDYEVLKKIFANGHEALQAAIEIVPTIPQFLTPVLSGNFPYMKKPTVFQESYVRNLLQITKYLPSLRQKVLELIVDHLIKIDVEVPKHELEHEQSEIDDEDDRHMQFEVEMDVINHEPQGIEKNHEEMTMKNEMADKLDILMVHLFKYIYEITHTNGDYNVDAATELFHDLLVVFENVILPTHASCHVQFIMFQLCSLDLVFANSLLDLCWKKIDDTNTPTVLRQASAAYVSSLTARAKYISVRLGPSYYCVTCNAVDELVTIMFLYFLYAIDLTWLNYVECSPNMFEPHFTLDSLALFYIFIFRYKQLLELEGGLKYIRRLNLERIVTCRLNPLKVCLPTAVQMFAHITRQHEIVFCYTIIERNNRMMLPVATTTSRTVSSLTLTNQLDSFFPFDPYLLRRSAKYIKPFYQEWEGLEHDEEEDEGRKLSDIEDEGEDYLEYSKTPDATVPGFTPEAPMCISPGFVSPINTRSVHKS